MSELSELDKAGDRLTERAGRMSGQLGNWTMAANAGGIAFILTAARDGKVPLGLLGGAYTTFIVGLILGFLGHLLLVVGTGAIAAETGKYVMAREGLERRANMRSESEQKGEKSADFTDLDKADEEIVDQWTKSGLKVGGTMAGIGTLFYTIAAACAVFGLMAPINMGLFK